MESLDRLRSRPIDKVSNKGSLIRQSVGEVPELYVPESKLVELEQVKKYSLDELAIGGR